MARGIVPQNNNGGIRLRFSVGGKRYSLDPIAGGKFENQIDLDRAVAIANLISSDIALGQFDSSLVKYGGARSDTAKQIREAQERLEREKREFENRQFLWVWEKYKAFKTPTLAPNTLAIDYGRRMAFLTKLAGENLPAPALIDWIIKNKPQGQAKKILQNLSAAHEWGIKRGLIDTNPFKGAADFVRADKEDGEDINPFTPGERDRLILAFQENRFFAHYAPLVQFLFFTGCRPSEAIPLEWGDLRGNRLTFQRTYSEGQLSPRLKTQKKRTIALNQNAIAALSSPQKIESPLIFPSKSGNYLDWHNFANRAWVGVLESLPDIEYRNPKQTRHTFITERILAGDSPVDVARYVGNSPGIIYRRYLGGNRDYKPE